MFRRARLDCLALAALLCVLALAAYQYRRAFIRAIFIDGPGQVEGPHLAMSADAVGLAPAKRVRVVLVDGLSRSVAMTLPNHNQLCRRGHDLVVDTGFPTVSLPVQHVLWTGLTQQQSGVLFRGKKQIVQSPRPAPAHGIPARTPGSVAIAQSHAYIVHALGFARVLPDSAGQAPDTWNDDEFMEAARGAVAGPAPLVFVHILGVDVAGHRLGGRDSGAYRDAAEAADRVLGQLMDADRAVHGQGTRWFLLADHGHRGAGLVGPGGGHGSAEPWIRQVRGCIAGELDSPVAVQPGQYIHLVDYSRAIADSLGLALDPRSAGRPLYAATRTTIDQGATLPGPGLLRWLAAGIIVLAALFFTGWAARGRWAYLPWWWPVALASVFVLAATPSLSVPMVYKPLGRDIYTAALPGLAVLAVLAARALGNSTSRQDPARMVLAQLALPGAGAVAAAAGAGGVNALLIALGLASAPPLMPWFTAFASTLIVLFYAGALVCALALVIRALWPRPAS